MTVSYQCIWDDVIIMSTTNNVGIVDSWSLVEFKNLKGKMKVTDTLVNKETGEKFKSCAFVNDAGKVTLVGFSSKLGELTPKQIKIMKNDLQVVELESGRFKLCKKGNFDETWEDVDI